MTPRSAGRVYARFIRTAVVWREAAVDLEGDPSDADWEGYWAARQAAMEAGSELTLVAPAEVLSHADEAMEALLDIAFNYDVNGPEYVQHDALWVVIAIADREMEAFRDSARTPSGPLERDWPGRTLQTRRATASDPRAGAKAD